MTDDMTGVAPALRADRPRSARLHWQVRLRGQHRVWSVALIVPGLIGFLVGAPLIARELEYGTWRLAWSQTVPRARWLTVKLALVTGGLVVLGAAMTAVITWYRAPMDRLTGHLLHNIYDFEGLVLTAYILCAFGFAVPAGPRLRRSIPAMIAAFIPWLAIRLVVEFLFARTSWPR